MLVLLLEFVLLQLQHNIQNVKWKTSTVSPHTEEAAIFYFFLAKSQIVKQASFAM
jgi:hypothetical protein